MGFKPSLFIPVFRFQERSDKRPPITQSNSLDAHAYPRARLVTLTHEHARSHVLRSCTRIVTCDDRHVAVAHTNVYTQADLQSSSQKSIDP